MPLIVPEEVLKEAGMTEQEVRLELACRLFDLGKLYLSPAAKLAGLSRVDMEEELARRNIPIYRPTIEDFEQDLASIEHVKKLRAAECPPSSPTPHPSEP